MINIPSYLGYPGHTVIKHAANQAELTCFMLASMTLVGINMLFTPWSKMMGKSLVSERPLMIPWLILSFVLLGVMPGRSIKRSLQQTAIESWNLPGLLRKNIPIPVEEASMTVQRYWTIFLTMAVIAHHRLMGQLDGAIIIRPWLKAVIVILLIAFSGEALLGRLKYELAKPR